MLSASGLGGGVGGVGPGGVGPGGVGPGVVLAVLVDSIQGWCQEVY